MAIDKLFKNSGRFYFSFESLGEARKGHKENIKPPTEEQWQQYRDAHRLWADLQENPYFQIVGYDWEEDFRELEPTYDWVWDETEEEWRARW